MIRFSKTYFRWREPNQNSEESFYNAVKGFLRMIGVVLVSSSIFLFLLKHAYGFPISKPLIALAGIVLLVVVIYFVHAKVPPYVVVTNRLIYRGLNDETADEWKYTNISRCEFSTMVIDGNVYNTMNIVTTNGEQSEIIIAPGISVDALRAFLLTRGIQGPQGSTKRYS
jgi:hypothetical protein